MITITNAELEADLTTLSPGTETEYLVNHLVEHNMFQEIHNLADKKRKEADDALLADVLLVLKKASTETAGAILNLVSTGKIEVAEKVKAEVKNPDDGAEAVNQEDKN